MNGPLFLRWKIGLKKPFITRVIFKYFAYLTEILDLNSNLMLNLQKVKKLYVKFQTFPEWNYFKHIFQVT